MNVRILLVDDHPMLRKGLRQTLAQQPNLTVVGEASTGASALKLAAELAPDLIVMDIHLPDETKRRLKLAVSFGKRSSERSGKK